MLRACGIEPAHWDALMLFNYILFYFFFWRRWGYWWEQEIKYSRGMLAFVKIQVVVSAE